MISVTSSIRRALLCAPLLSVLLSTGNAQTFNYAEVLQKSMFFYEAQRSGFLPANNRVSWRGDSALADGFDVGRDLTGGWYDAGDHVKFGFPMAFSVTALAWGAIDFRQGYVDSGQLQFLKNNLRFVTDYFIRCHTAPNEFYGQVGAGGPDHSWWGPAEVMMMNRPSFKIDTAHPGSDLAGETAAALAAVSMLFATDDPAYAATLRAHAIQLYNFADNFRGVYTSGIPDASGFYNSWSGFNDELVWGAIWLYRATGDAAWLAKAEAYYANLGTEPQLPIKSYHWTLAWDDKAYGCYVLLAKLTGNPIYKADAERNLDYWTAGIGGQRINYSPGGLAWLDQWGSLRYAANAAFLAMYYQDVATTPAKSTAYYNFAKRQIDYALGSNPANRSYVCGFGVNPPVSPHHRTAHGGWSNNLVGPPTATRHILYGALVGGPNLSDSYVDDRGDFQKNEVATDYNALFSGVLAKLVDDFGGTPLANFPVRETPTGEFLVEVRQNAAGTTFMELAVWVSNHTAWPARIPSQFKFRIFVNITEGIAGGFTASQYVVNTNNGGVVTVTPLILWNAATNVYYTEVTFRPTVVIWPGGQGESSEEAQVRIGLPNNAPASAWSAANDFSFQGIGSGSLAPTTFIPLYVNGTLAVGTTPPGGGPITSVTGVTLTPATVTVAAGATTPLTATVAPANATDPTVSWSTSSSAVATVSGAGVVTGVSAGTATITVTTNDGNFTDTTIVTVTVPNTLTVTPATLSFTTAAGSSPVAVASNGSWTVTDNQTWITVTPTSGTGNGSLAVSVTANTGVARTGTVTVTGGGFTRTIAVNQQGIGTTLTVTPATLSFTAVAGSNTVAVASTVAWTVTDDQTWITVTPVSGANNATLTVSVTANTGAARTGTVTVAGGGLTQTVAVSQAPGIGDNLAVSTTALAFTSAAGSNTFGITSNVSWTVADDQTWITTTPASGANNATITVAVTANAATTSRTGTITVTGGGLTRTISVTQAGTVITTLCTTPVAITLSFARDGAGDFCWVTAGNINFINSWNMQLLEVNGVNLTGLWRSGAQLPPRINGNYYIHYVGQFPWSHFEANGSQ